MTDDAPYRFRKRFLDCKNLTIEEAEEIGEWLSVLARDVQFHIGDLARYCQARWPDRWNQVFPEWVSPGLIQRTAAVCKAYPNESDREAEATYTIYMREANKHDRLERVAAHAEAGHTSDEARDAPVNTSGPRWLLAVDVSYWLASFWHSGSGMETAMSVASWIDRMKTRLQQDFKKRPLTDLVCCFDGPDNHRRQLTQGWDDAYKGHRGEKDPEHIAQLRLVRDILNRSSYCCAEVDGMEGDDLLASYATQFDGHVTLLTQDKDVRQCLSETCNILYDIEWVVDEDTGDRVHTYKWITVTDHISQFNYNSATITGIHPSQFTEFQILAGDNVDNISGAANIGAVNAAKLVTEFGSAKAAIEAAKNGDERITAKKRQALIDFEPKLEATRKLVTLRTDCPVPTNTRL